MKKILITGNSGYIGSHLTMLLKDEYVLHGLDLKVPQIDTNYHLIRDIRRPSFHLDRTYDAVVHLAALVNVGESVHEPIAYYDTNMNGTMNVLRNTKTKNFILASTGGAQDCLSPYSVSKRAAEDCTRQFCEENDTPFTIFRFYNVIGSDGIAPTNPDGLMYNLWRAPETRKFTIFGDDYDCSKDGTCVRDYVHVMEVCNAIRLAIEKPSGQIECLGHGVGYTVQEMVRLFQRVNEVEFRIEYGPRRAGDLPSSVLENVSPYMEKLYAMEELLVYDLNNGPAT
jgi:UDP-glucose 4-epimerase